MQNLTLIQSILLFAVPAIFAITVHEAAHGFAARHFGDRTAEVLGRLTLNPIKHIDPIGTVLVPLGLLVMSKTIGGPPFLFGWAKPVPVGTRNLRNPKRDMALVAAAGPASNLAMALGWTAIFAGANAASGTLPAANLLALMAYFGMFFNAILAVLNMVPIPGFDGFAVIEPLLSPSFRDLMRPVANYGPLIAILAIWRVEPVSDAFWTAVTASTELFGVEFEQWQCGYFQFKFWESDIPSQCR